jgi:hypothetical protein
MPAARPGILKTWRPAGARTAACAPPWTCTTFRPAGARAAAVLAADAAFAHVLAERTALVPQVAPYRPGEFYLRRRRWAAGRGDYCGCHRSGARSPWCEEGGAATWTCGSGRSPCAARAARPGPSRSASTPPAAWTGTCVSAPGTPRHGRPQLWRGAGNRGPMTASGIYQVTVPGGRQCGIEVFPHRSGTTSATPGSTAGAPRAT